MNELFWIFLIFAIGSVAFVFVQAVMIFTLAKHNQELRQQVKDLEPPF